MTVSLSTDGAVGRLTLERPEALNALNREVAGALEGALGQLDQSQDVSVVVVSGRGRAFCAGNDIAEMPALSGAAQALEDTLAYLRERQAFGEPLAAKQALRHRVADMATEIEAARRLVYHAATLYAAGEECVTEVSMAKLFATEVANRIAYHAVQLHGGYGYMREFHVEGFFRDVRLYPIASGTSEVMREIIAKRLLT